jgi:hypothetical protein
MTQPPETPEPPATNPVVAPPAPAIQPPDPVTRQVTQTLTTTGYVPPDQTGRGPDTLGAAAPLPAVWFDPPFLEPSPSGLYGVTQWTEDTGPSRYLGEGVLIRMFNYGGHHAFGVWDATWCAQPDDIKDGYRPDPLPVFEPIVVWGYDECDLTAPSQLEVLARAQQTLLMQEQTAVEREFAARMIADIGGSASTISGDIVKVVGEMDGRFAEAGTMGYLHASPHLAAVAADRRVNLGGRTPMGNRWVFGGGYVQGLSAGQVIATSQPFGWRSAIEVREAIKYEHNLFVAVAERALVIGYEALVGAATVTP